MTTSMLASGRAKVPGNLKAPLAKSCKRVSTPVQCYSSSATASPQSTNGRTRSPAKGDDAATQRELFMNVLTANATKRDAKQYLARFKPAKDASTSKTATLSPLEQERNARHRRDQDRLDRSGVNLGGLYAPARAIAESPQFTQPHVGERTAATPQQTLHVALVCLRAPESLDDATLEGVATTLSQLVKLDMRIAIVLDCGGDAGATSMREQSSAIKHQCDRLAKVIGKHSTKGARLVLGALELTDEGSHGSVQGTTDSAATVSVPSLLTDPLKRSVIPIVPTLAHTATSQLVQIPATTIMIALSRLFSGLPTSPTIPGDSRPTINTSLDRIIVLDEAGGVPSKARGDGAHVFINLDQEYSEIEGELVEYGKEIPTVTDARNVYEQHRSNLAMTKACLTLLPSASSALVITPQEAAVSSQSTEDDSSIGAGTRRRRNTLIHNLLTNKPIVSSSLPVARLPPAPGADADVDSPDMPRATLIKRGMPVTIIPPPDPTHGWLAPASGQTTLDLETDPRVDLPRLVHLIEDSFRRKLDVRHYLDRIRGRTAGLIVAGEYEGGAILTWETPPGALDSDPSRLVPYLDKFAVLSNSQGSSGVADIVFQAMVRTCFPAGVCWRSRKDNPVNKWYFERSEGTWMVPESNWTMFWTGEGVVEGRGRWEDYVGACRGVGPSWADKGRVAD
ncbi:Amino-acid acetyltransferase, mitochondrial [Saxophila tyrrhenica]|uniref:Amino-acid acetyltransferase, mitochondrial n=1 Tax=Saxophila tyrrhenica TaxID=1690608 RepID=A0AAV9NXN7_9PEZI|nr:Amino-acid acetyltransferase, mitochondrial [Saxophila tyrrhenica]